LIDPQVHVIAALAVCSRIADLWTTYLVTPTLKLEANSLARRFGWRFGLVTIAIGLLTYIYPPLGVMIFTASFMVAAANASKITMAKALGEEEFAALMLRILERTPPWPGLLFLLMPGIFSAVLGASMVFFYHSAADWGYYFGIGMFTYALAVFFWYPIRYFRIRRDAREAPGKS
jgi:hypothetical protein